MVLTYQVLQTLLTSGKAHGKTKEIIQQQINHSSINVSWIKEPDILKQHNRLDRKL